MSRCSEQVGDQRVLGQCSELGSLVQVGQCVVARDEDDPGPLIQRQHAQAAEGARLAGVQQFSEAESGSTALQTETMATSSSISWHVISPTARSSNTSTSVLVIGAQLDGARKCPPRTERDSANC